MRVTRRARANHKFDGVIFDLDGTLIDSLEDIATAANEVLSELGKPTHTFDEFRYLVGDGVGMLFQRALPECLQDELLRQRCMDLFESRYEHCWNIRSKPYPGIVELINSLVDDGVAIAVLSNKPDRFTKQCAEYFFPKVPFSPVVGHSDQFPRKPDPKSARWIGAQWDFAINRIAYVGDTNTDMKTAVGAGYFAIGVSWGFRSVSELIESGAQAICNDAASLQKTLLE